MGFKREGIVALTPDRTLLAYWCQGCDGIHMVNVEPGSDRPRWEWDGNTASPTLAPSIREFWPARAADDDHPARAESTRCHHFLRAGVIEFLSDSEAHQVRGKHPLQPIPAGYGGVND